MLAAIAWVWVVGISGPTAAAEKCHFSTYVVDKDPKGLNVRAEPNSKSSVIAVLPNDSDGTIVDIRGSEGSWLQIVKAETIEGKQVFQGKGWVFAELVGTSTRYEGTDHALHAQASLKSPIVGKIPGEKEVTLRGCSGTWPKVKWKSIEGYLSPDQHCPNPVTTCP